MALAPGSKLGVYEVIAKIGAGGMGEVFRAHDTTLDRDVAIKVLPDAFATDPERLARFEREAKVLASLNHPNIAAIYGLEKSADTRALILELVEGPTLQDRIANGPIPLDWSSSSTGPRSCSSGCRCREPPGLRWRTAFRRTVAVGREADRHAGGAHPRDVTRLPAYR